MHCVDEPMRCLRAQVTGNHWWGDKSLGQYQSPDSFLSCSEHSSLEPDQLPTQLEWFILHHSLYDLVVDCVQRRIYGQFLSDSKWWLEPVTRCWMFLKIFSHDLPRMWAIETPLSNLSLMPHNPIARPGRRNLKPQSLFVLASSCMEPADTAVRLLPCRLSNQPLHNCQTDPQST